VDVAKILGTVQVPCSSGGGGVQASHPQLDGISSGIHFVLFSFTDVSGFYPITSTPCGLRAGVVRGGIAPSPVSVYCICERRGNISGYISCYESGFQAMFRETWSFTGHFHSFRKHISICVVMGLWTLSIVRTVKYKKY
jgi:hypothetical protein